MEMLAEPEDVLKPEKKKVVRVPVARCGLRSKGTKILLFANHFKVVTNVDVHFFHYSVSLSYENGHPVAGKGIRRRVIDKMHNTVLAGKVFAYDGEESLFTVVDLPRKKLESTVVLEDAVSLNRNDGNGSPGGNGSPNQCDRKRLRYCSQPKTFKVEITFVAKIPMLESANALCSQQSENSQEALRVLNIIIRQHAAKQGCFQVRQSFFHNDSKNFFFLGGGVLGLGGFHSSFQTTQQGLSLISDVSTTMIIQPGPVLDFLTANQNVKDPLFLDWVKAKCVLKNLRVKTSPSNTEHKISGLSDKSCKELTFLLKQRTGKDEDGEVQTLEVTVYDYFVNYRHIKLHFADLPCIIVGKPKQPTFFPLELCSLVSLQRYTKALSTLQRTSLVEKSRQKPYDGRQSLQQALESSNYGDEPMLHSCGISISTLFTQFEGHILSAPMLKVGNEANLFPRNGQWSFKNKKLVCPTKIKQWAVVNFSAPCDINSLVRDLIKCGEMKGVHIDNPICVFEENPESKLASAVVRVEKMFEDMKSKLPSFPQFLLCLLPERKKSDLYGLWKRKTLCEIGIITQCIAPIWVNDQYLTNVLLKINAKLGGLNSVLALEYACSIPLVSKVPTIILGMDVSHGSPGQSDVPSIAAVVSSRQWPFISHYRASVRSQSPKLEMIDSLFKRASDTEDGGIMRELLLDFYVSSQKRKPDQIIIFRDGVSESQFNQVLNIELGQIIEACKFLDENWSPKFVVIVAQKKHHTKFFVPGSYDNVPPGTIIDNKVCHPWNNDFYLCAHAGMIGTTRPTHYHVLLDEVGFPADDLQDLVHSLSYISQRSTTATSVVAPICYAHLAATQMGQLMKFEDMLDASSHGALTSAGAVPVPELPKLHKNVCNSMFFC